MNKIQQFSLLSNPKTIHGFIFDLVVLAGNIVFSVSILDLSVDLPDRTIGILLGVAVITQLLGAVLKTNPLRYRLSGTPARSSADILDKL
jgi:hypothetical protein